MNEEQAKAAMIKQTRREILRALNLMYYIGPLSFEALCGALRHLQLPDDQCVKRDLVYLVDKDYVDWANSDNAYMPWRQRLYKLTARGNEIANRIDTDPALEPSGNGE